MVLDLFAGGAGGWDLAARSLGLTSVGIEWDAPSCATRAVVGLATIRADVSTYPPERFAGVEGVCGSPPCQSFSSAGKGAGLADPRGQMVYEPMRYVRVIRPRWVALEQVPEVLGYWRWIKRELVEMGYGVWCGILNAADYGVPQIRKRAILLASLDRQAVPPTPTHSRTGHDDLFGGGLAKWETMAEALGWDGRVWMNCDNNTDDNVYTRPTTEPAYTVTEKGNRWKLLSPGRSYTAKPRVADPATDPAPTVALVHNASSWCWERPATTVTASTGVVNPGGGGAKVSMSERGIVPIEAWELGVLQGFPADHPWQAPHVSAQIGNAIPPPLALACLRSITGAQTAEAAT